MMKKVSIVFILITLILVSISICYSGQSNANPADAFTSYQVALREENVNLLTEVYVIQNSASMSQNKLMQELKYLKRYDSFRNYAIIQVLQNGNVAMVKVKGTLHGKEGVRRTFKLKNFNNGWKITDVFNQ